MSALFHGRGVGKRTENNGKDEGVVGKGKEIDDIFRTSIK